MLEQIIRFAMFFLPIILLMVGIIMVHIFLKDKKYSNAMLVYICIGAFNFIFQTGFLGELKDIRSGLEMPIVAYKLIINMYIFFALGFEIITFFLVRRAMAAQEEKS